MNFDSSCQKAPKRCRLLSSSAVECQYNDEEINDNVISDINHSNHKDDIIGDVYIDHQSNHKKKTEVTSSSQKNKNITNTKSHTPMSTLQTNHSSLPIRKSLRRKSNGTDCISKTISKPANLLTENFKYNDSIIKKDDRSFNDVRKRLFPLCNNNSDHNSNIDSKIKSERKENNNKNITKKSNVENLQISTFPVIDNNPSNLTIQHSNSSCPIIIPEDSLSTTSSSTSHCSFSPSNRNSTCSFYSTRSYSSIDSIRQTPITAWLNNMNERNSSQINNNNTDFMELDVSSHSLHHSLSIKNSIDSSPIKYTHIQDIHQNTQIISSSDSSDIECSSLSSDCIDFENSKSTTLDKWRNNLIMKAGEDISYDMKDRGEPDVIHEMDHLYECENSIREENKTNNEEPISKVKMVDFGIQTNLNRIEENEEQKKIRELTSMGKVIINSQRRLYLMKCLCGSKNCRGYI